MKRLLPAILTIFLLATAAYGADDFYESQLNSGIRNSDVSSYMLMEQARADNTQAGSLLKKAAQHSPDLPAVYFELAKSKLSFRYSDMLQCIDYLIAGINAYGRNFWWSFSLAGSAVLGLFFSFIGTFLFIVIIRSIQDFPLISHELVESRQNALLLLGFIVLSVFSPLLLLAGLLVLAGMYMSRLDRVVVYIYLVFLLAAPAVFSAAGKFVSVPSSGKIKAMVDVNEAKGNVYALASLKTASDPAAVFSHGLALKRAGLFDESIKLYEGLMKSGQDAASYVNMGNAYAGLSRYDDAIKSYQAAVNIRPLASAYYNLSQVSREMLNFEKGNEYFEKAVEVDRYAVMGYRTYSERNPNRMFADETLEEAALWNYAWNSSPAGTSFRMVILPAWVLSAASLLMMAAFYLMNRHAKNKAYRCRRCQAIFCPQCEKHIMWGQMCPQCFRSLIKLEELETRERVARLLSIYDHQKRRRDIMKWLSFILPGASQVYGGKILIGFVLMWPFMFFVLLPAAACIMRPDPYGSHWLVIVLSLIVAAGLLVVSNIFTRQRISKGWL